MKIITFEPKRFRWECEIVESVEPFSARRRWFLFHEDIEAPVHVRSLAEASEYIRDRNHPAWAGLYSIMRDSRDDVELLPWQPFEPHPDLLEAFGPHAIERVQAKDLECKVWSSVRGRVWHHVPGDTAVDPSLQSGEGS